MLRKPSPQQTAIEVVTLERLGPGDHLLRKIDAAIDVGFIREMTEDLYCADNGRLPVPPVKETKVGRTDRDAGCMVRDHCPAVHCEAMSREGQAEGVLLP